MQVYCTLVAMFWIFKILLDIISITMWEYFILVWDFKLIFKALSMEEYNVLLKYYKDTACT